MKSLKVYNYLQLKEKALVEVPLTKGVVIKIDSFVFDGRDYHNYWGLILHNYKNDTFRVLVKIEEYMSDVIVISMSNIKCVIGTKEIDAVDIGEQRHRDEVVRLIDKYINF